MDLNQSAGIFSSTWCHVSLREKGVDLNFMLSSFCLTVPVSLREKGVDLNKSSLSSSRYAIVSLREKGVDLNSFC